MSDTIDLSSINLARDSLQKRQAGLIKTIRDRNGGRITAENANQDTSWEGKWLNQDQERGRQLDWLEKSLRGDDLTKFTDQEATAREADTVHQAETMHRRQSGMDAAQAARTGQAGSSVDAEQKASLAAALGEAKIKAKQQADELRAAGIQGVDAMERQLVDQIMADNGSYQAAQQAALNGQQVEIRGAEMQAGLDSSYRNILANAISQALHSDVTPAIEAGFNNADRRNQKSQNEWEQWNNNGRTGTAPTITDNTWWGF